MRRGNCRGELKKFRHMNSYTFGDSVELMKLLPDKCVDLVFTSPPDMSQTDMDDDQFFEWKKSVMTDLARVTKDSGFVVISQQDRKLNGRIQLNHVHYINMMAFLKFIVKDEKVVVRNAPGRIDLYKFTYQYLTVFTRRGRISKRHGDWLKDIIVDREDNVAGQYVWSQKLCRMVIETLTMPGDFVIDPFAGYGPVLYAAKQLGRNYWGGENEPSRYNKDFAFFKRQQQYFFE